MSKLNPFDKFEDWKLWFEQDKSYNLHLKKTLKVYMDTNFKKPSLIMTLKDNYLKFIYFTAKHTVLTASLIFILVAGIGAAAAESVAPQDLKPSTIAKNLFISNKQADKDPYTALKPDDNNFVILSEKCDLAVKFPKQIDGEDVVAYRSDPAAIDDVSLMAKNNPATNSKLVPFRISCINLEKSNYFTEGMDLKSFKTMNSKEMRNKFGWFITEGNLQNVRYITNDDTTIMFFEHRGLLYSLVFRDQDYKPTPDELKFPTFGKNYNAKGIFANQVQFQFNSLVKSEANTEVQSLNTKDNMQLNKYVSDKCDLAVMYHASYPFEKDNRLTLPNAESYLPTGVQDAISINYGNNISCSKKNIGNFDKFVQESMLKGIKTEAKPFDFSGYATFSEDFKKATTKAIIKEIGKGDSKSDRFNGIEIIIETKDNYYTITATKDNLQNPDFLRIGLKSSNTDQKPGDPVAIPRPRPTDNLDTANLDIKLVGNGCHNQTDNGLEKCDIVDAKTNKTLALFRDCKDGGVDSRCIYNGAILGRKTNDGHYILEAGSEGGAAFVRVYEFKLKDKSINKLSEINAETMFFPQCDPYLYKTWPDECKDQTSDRKTVDNYITYRETFRKYGPENNIYTSFTLLGAGMGTYGYTLLEKDQTKEVYVVKSDIFDKALGEQKLTEKARIQISGEAQAKVMNLLEPTPDTKSAFEITKIEYLIVV